MLGNGYRSAGLVNKIRHAVLAMVAKTKTTDNFVTVLIALKNIHDC